MKKILTWVLNHSKAALAILTFGVTLIVIGAVMLGSYSSYKAYERRYNANDLAVRSAAAASAKRVEVNDSYKTKLKNKLVVDAIDLVEESEHEYVASGNVTLDLTIELEQTSFVDIDLYVRSAYTVSDETQPLNNIFSNITFSVNGTVMDEEIDLEGDDAFHHIIFGNFALPEGDVKIQLASKSGKANLMPDVMSIGFYSNAKASLAE